MGVFCDRLKSVLKFGSTADLACRTGQNKDRYWKKEALLLLNLLGLEVFGLSLFDGRA
jgi:hypothetical protein